MLQKCRSMSQEMISSHVNIRNVWTWVGLSDEAQEQDFFWEDGSELSWSLWADGQPDNLRNGQDCVVYSSITLSWHDVMCENLYSFFCQYRPFYDVYTYHSESEVNHTQARETCAAEGEILAIPHSEEEFNRLVDFVYTQSLDAGWRHKEFWIGLRDDVIEGEYRWDDNRLLTWSAWQDEPHVPVGWADWVYVSLNSTYGNRPYWADDLCDYSDPVYHVPYFVCQRI